MCNTKLTSIWKFQTAGAQIITLIFPSDTTTNGREKSDLNNLRINYLFIYFEMCIWRELSFCKGSLHNLFVFNNIESFQIIPECSFWYRTALKSQTICCKQKFESVSSVSNQGDNSHELSLVHAGHSTIIQGVYVDTHLFLYTSNNCNYLLSKTEFVLSDGKKHVSSNIEEQIFFNFNANTWSIHKTDNILKKLNNLGLIRLRSIGELYIPLL